VEGKEGVVNGKVICDKYVFTLANFSNPLPRSPISFAFPTQCQQVFFSDKEEQTRRNGGDWKVVCGTEVRGHHRDVQMGRQEIAILARGRDTHFKGLKM